MQGTHRTFCAQCVFPRNIFHYIMSACGSGPAAHQSEPAHRKTHYDSEPGERPRHPVMGLTAPGGPGLGLSRPDAPGAVRTRVVVTIRERRIGNCKIGPGQEQVFSAPLGLVRVCGIPAYETGRAGLDPRSRILTVNFLIWGVMRDARLVLPLTSAPQS